MNASPEWKIVGSTGKRGFFITILLLTLLDCISQVAIPPLDLRFDRFNAQNHFINQYIQAVARDAKGYIWAGANGVIRFDGVQSTSFTNFNNQHHQLQDNYVDAIAVDCRNRVWVGTGRELAYYDAQQNSFKKPLLPAGKKIEYAFRLRLWGDRLWFASNLGLSYVDLLSDSVHTTSVRSLFDPTLIYPIDENTLLVNGVSAGLFFYNMRSGAVIPLKTKTHTPPPSVWNVVRCQGQWLLATNKGLWRLQDSSGYIEPIAGTEQYSLSDALLYPRLTGTNLVWLASTTGGLLLYNPATQQIVQTYQHSDQNPYSISGNNISTLHLDQDQKLWIGTETGLCVLDPGNQWIKTQLLPFSKAGSHNNYVSSLKQDASNKDIVWIVCRGQGLVKLDWERKKILKHYPNIDVLQQPTGAVYDMAETPDRQWLLLKKSDLLLWNEKTEKASQAVKKPLQSNFHSYKQIISRGDGCYYLLSNKGLFEYNYTQRQITPVFLPDRGTSNLYPGQMTHGVWDTAQQKLWIATQSGLVCHDKRTNKTYTYYNRSHNDTVNNNFLFNLFMAGNGEVWCATRTGISVFNPSHRQFSLIENFGSIRQPQCFGVYVQPPHAFINSNAGLILYNIQTGVSKVVPVNNSAIEDYSLHSFTRIGSELVSGFRNSFSYFDLSGVEQHNMPSAPVIEAVQVNGSFYIGSDRKLSYKQNLMGFSFTAFNFANPAGIRFRYRLEGLDTQWHEAKGGRSATFYGLDPGEYRFSVQSGNGDGYWKRDTASYSFSIMPPFWKRRWFYVALAISGVALTVMMLRHWAAKKHAHMKEKAYQQELLIQQYRHELELEQIALFFSQSLLNKSTREEVLTDVSKNLIARLGFENCMIYIVDEERQMLLQHTGFGKKGTIQTNTDAAKYHLQIGEGIVGAAVASRKAILVNDTSADSRYITVDGLRSGSELCVPLLSDQRAFGAINVEDTSKNFFTTLHLQTLTTIAALVASKLEAVERSQALYQKELQLSETSKKLLESELAMLRSQMNPHFIFNSLNSIQKYIWEAKEDEAAEYLSSFAKLMRAILKNSREEYITVAEELKGLKLYVALEHRRSSGHFDYIIQIDETLQQDELLIPPLLLQPFIENAIWHGLAKKPTKGHLYIGLQIKAGQLVCTVEDDGAGRTPKKEDPKARKSLGISITQQRIQQISQQTGKVATFTIEDKVMNGDPAGTKVLIHLPLILNQHHA